MRIVNNTGLDLEIDVEREVNFGGEGKVITISLKQEPLEAEDMGNEPTHMLIVPGLDYPETIAEFLDGICCLETFVNDDGDLVLIK